MSRMLFLPVLLLVVATGSSALGQEDLLSELYGLGVHAYNSGDYRDAYENLSAAVEGGTKDPRAFYFRGLALVQLGRPEDARLDFAKGAQLEVAGGGDRYPIGRALERIQGVQRLTIERVRQVEKIKYQQAQLAESKRRYEDQKQIQAQEPVLNSKTPAEVPPPTEMIDKGVVPPAAEGDPFGDDGLGVGAAEPAPEHPTSPAGEEPAAETGDDPFGTEPAGETPKEPAAGGDDPFGGEPATEEPAAGGDDPFGDAPAGEEPAGDDPFGEAPAAEEPAGEAPAAEEPPPADDDPFGAGEAPAAEEKPATEEPAGEDPFGAAPAAGGAAPVAAKPAAGEGGAVRDVVRGVGAAIGKVGAGADDGRDPFDDSDEPKAPAATGGAAVDKPAPPAAGDAGEDPFADDAAEPAPAGDDPFAN